MVFLADWGGFGLDLSAGRGCPPHPPPYWIGVRGGVRTPLTFYRALVGGLTTRRARYINSPMQICRACESDMYQLTRYCLCVPFYCRIPWANRPDGPAEHCGRCAHAFAFHPPRCTVSTFTPNHRFLITVMKKQRGTWGRFRLPAALSVPRCAAQESRWVGAG